MAFLVPEQPTSDEFLHEGFMVASAVAQLDWGNHWNLGLKLQGFVCTRTLHGVTRSNRWKLELVMIPLCDSFFQYVHDGVL